MDEYISREAALEAIEKHKDGMAKTGGVSNKGKALYLLGQDHAIDVLRIVPAADVKPVVPGKWLTEEHFERTIDGSTIAIRATYCSECGCVLLGKFGNFCPNCGAKMEVNDER